VYLDNQLVVDQINDLADVNSDHLKRYHAKALDLLRKLPTLGSIGYLENGTRMLTRSYAKCSTLKIVPTSNELARRAGYE